MTSCLKILCFTPASLQAFTLTQSSRVSPKVLTVHGPGGGDEHSNLILYFPAGNNLGLSENDIAVTSLSPQSACPPFPWNSDGGGSTHSSLSPHALLSPGTLTGVYSQLTVIFTFRTSGAATSFKALHSYSPDWSRLMSEISRYSSSLTKPWPSGRKETETIKKL